MQRIETRLAIKAKNLSSRRNGKTIWSIERKTQQKAMGKERVGDRHWESPKKIKMHEQMQFIACNVRGINTPGKKQDLTEQWGRDKIDVAMISEVQKNTGGIEKGAPLGASIHASIAQGLTRS